MKRIILAALVGLAACAVQPEYFKGPSGKDAYTMGCSGIGRGWNKCFTKAAELCPNGYNVINSITLPWVQTRTLVVECK